MNGEDTRTERESRNAKKEVPEHVWQKIRSDIEGLSYGTVVVTVHNGAVVQVETSTKTRFQ